MLSIIESLMIEPLAVGAQIYQSLAKWSKLVPCSFDIPTNKHRLTQLKRYRIRLSMLQRSLNISVNKDRLAQLKRYIESEYCSCIMFQSILTSQSLPAWFLGPRTDRHGLSVSSFGGDRRLYLIKVDYASISTCIQHPLIRNRNLGIFLSSLPQWVQLGKIRSHCKCLQPPWQALSQRMYPLIPRDLLHRLNFPFRVQLIQLIHGIIFKILLPYFSWATD